MPGDADGGVLLGEPLDDQRLVDLARVVERVGFAGEDRAVAGRRQRCRAPASFVSVLLPQSRMMRPRMLRDHRRHHRQRAVVERGGAERDLGAIEVDVVAGPQLGDAGLAGAEAQRRRRADRDLVERDARGGGAGA